MKNWFNKIKINIFKWHLLFMIMFILIQFVLYLFDIRFRLWVIFFFVLLNFIVLVLGVIQRICIKKSIFNYLGVEIIFLGCLYIVLNPFISVTSLLSLRREYSTSLFDQRYVAVVDNSSYTDVYYYEDYGSFLMGTKVKVYGYFGKEKFDPFVQVSLLEQADYFYYDSKGKVFLKRHVNFIKDERGRITMDYDDTIYEKEEEYNDNDLYLLPEEEEVLYEKEFGDVILRFAIVDYVLGQNRLVHVLRSEDGGKNFYSVTEESIQVNQVAKFAFLDENLGFATVDNQILLDSSKAALYVTQNGGKTFLEAHFNYDNDHVSFISIDKMPYYDHDTLKIDCSVYQMDMDGVGYENKELIFISDDNGLTWNLKD